MDTVRIAERLSEGGAFTENQSKRIATTLADYLKDELAIKRDLHVLEARLRAEFQSGIASVRNQLLTAQVAAFFGIIRYFEFRLRTRPRGARPGRPPHRERHARAGRR
jgi:phosphoglycolate phosphatase-like HAD superfamily hydrolase